MRGSAGDRRARVALSAARRTSDRDMAVRTAWLLQPAGTEAQGAMRFLEELVKRPDAGWLGGRGRWHIGKDSTGSHHGFGAEEGYVSTKASLAWIVHDLKNSDSFYRCTDAAELVQSPHYGVTRRRCAPFSATMRSRPTATS